ncbi:adenylate kinase [Chryseobacterium nematophagum]|uniref:Adenylate kinase n=1 Tax=Chryseobacterium nematophagum TaxID=2305228 RepID=A0A3M7TD47_9FLAO|nr:AAA family ATPase [Chryseobacterium nematophagum]RNA61415.1 adenylate kinase [Chryseobacterium nematophagum]
MRIHILGASGSGVTTLGEILSKQLGIEYFDSDDFFWLKSDIPFTQRRKPDVRNKIISETLNSRKNWVFGGSVIRWGEAIFPQFDLVIFLYLPSTIRMKRLKKREYKRYGKEIAINPERAKQYRDFMIWAKDYDEDTGISNRTLNAHMIWLSTINSPILKIEGNYSIDEKLEIILNTLYHLSIDSL